MSRKCIKKYVNFSILVKKMKYTILLFPTWVNKYTAKKYLNCSINFYPSYSGCNLGFLQKKILLMKCYSMQYHFMLKNCKDGFFHMESFKSEIFLGWKIHPRFFRILIIEKEKFIFWEFPICCNITGIEFLPIVTIWNYWLIFELFHLGPNSPALTDKLTIK